jgi:hypothetical protein
MPSFYFNASASFFPSLYRSVFAVSKFASRFSRLSFAFDSIFYRNLEAAILAG